MATVPVIFPNQDEGGPGPSPLGTGEWNIRFVYPRVATLPLTFPSPKEGAPGPSLLGTGEGKIFSVYPENFPMDFIELWYIRCA